MRAWGEGVGTALNFKHDKIPKTRKKTKKELNGVGKIYTSSYDKSRSEISKIVNINFRSIG